ncbi:MAG: cell division protein ZipA [Ectothiorhodospiraceae bacterium]|nr:cell division protein ZipA [Ectothiorhodospiraceae bacterium]
MDDLRLILLVGGVVLVAGIYGFETWRRRRARAADEGGGDDPLERMRDARAARNARVVVSRRKPGRREARVEEDPPVSAPAPVSDFDIDDLDRLGSPSPPEPPPAPEMPARTRPDTPVDEDLPEPDLEAESVPEPSPGRVGRAEPAVGQLSGISARRDSPEQLDLAGFPAAPLEEADAPARPAAPPQPQGGRRGRRGESARPAEPPPEPLVVVITVMARDGRRFHGSDVLAVVEREGLEHGEMGAFHRFPRDMSIQTPVFSVLNVVKPGGFDLDTIEEITTPGLAMFLQCPGPEEPMRSFEAMIASARRIAEGLDGMLCDERRSTLTNQSVNHLRERIAEHGRRSRLRG